MFIFKFKLLKPCNQVLQTEGVEFRQGHYGECRILGTENQDIFYIFCLLVTLEYEYCYYMSYVCLYAVQLTKSGRLAVREK